MSDSATPMPSKHRIEALVDGIFAVTMTLLVIELRLPEHDHITSAAALQHAVGGLVPTFIAWVISFFVLAIFWVGNHRLYSHVRHADMKLVWITIGLLAGASLMPFATTLNSQYASPLSQTIYAAVMIVMAASAMLTARYLHHHPELCGHALTRGAYLATVTRNSVVVVVALATVALSYVAIPGTANMAYLLLFFVGPLGKRVQRHCDRAVAGASEAAAAPLQ